ncbi:MAG: hypothetical protein ACRCYO_10065 [Bacteroidia bacterium]
MFFGNFILTLFLEWPVFVLLTKKSWRETALFMLLMNLVTWPIATVLYNTTTISIWWIELGVFLAETVLVAMHWKFSWGKSALLALLMNASSWGIGSLIHYIWLA